MIPITHFVYFGLGLTVFGVVTAGVRRDAHGLVLHSQHAAWGIALVAAAYARWWGVAEGQVLAAIVVAFASVYGACIAWISAAALEQQQEHRGEPSKPRATASQLDPRVNSSAGHGADGDPEAGGPSVPRRYLDELEALRLLRD